MANTTRIDPFEAIAAHNDAGLNLDAARDNA